MAPLKLIRATFLFLLLCLLSGDFCLSIVPENPEVNALIGIRQSLKDPRGVLINWDEFSVNPCSWTLITCSSENLVIALGAPSQSLSGSLPGLIGNLTNLKQVLLQDNNISGKIPSEIGSLAKLQTLDLSNNAFSGPVPHSLGFLDSLQYLRLNNNTLSGFIPTSIAKIPHLAFVDLSFNNFTPPVPKFTASTFNVMGNPAICATNITEGCSAYSNAPISPSYPSNTTYEKNPNGAKVAIAIGISLSAACLLILAVGLFHLWQRQKQKKQYILNITDKQEEDLISFGNLRMFTVRELQVATNDFSKKNLVGSGGFGNVYKGNLGEGVVIAVKRLKDFGGASGESQFRTELEMISLAVHRHLLRLIGCCMSPTERILVYPYMANGSVASRLREKPALEWNMRKRIAIGAARGLLYLHEQCDPKIIHRDVKAANVLLDDYGDAVVADFGLAKLLDHSQSHVTTTVRGTVGHIAPEYLSTGRSSDKTDVFGFGILLLELLGGMQTTESGHKGGAMLERARKVEEERKVELLVDKELGTNYDIVEAGEMLQVALVCTQYSAGKRPTMSEVLRMLGGDGVVDKFESNEKPIKNIHGGGDIERNMYEEDDDEQSLDSYAMELSGPR